MILPITSVVGGAVDGDHSGYSDIVRLLLMPYLQPSSG